jgi:hypothetical protein
MGHGRRASWTGGPRPQHVFARDGFRTCPVAVSTPTTQKLARVKLRNRYLTHRFNTFLTETALHSEFAVTHSKQGSGTFLTGARTAFRHRTISTPATQKLARVKLRNRYDIHGSNTFLPGSAQQVEFAVTHSKHSTATFLPGSRIASLAHSKSSNTSTKLSEERAWLRL